MANYFECKVKYDRMTENGVQKTVSEPYLVDALSFTEAETRITQELKPYITGEFAVEAVKRVRLSDIFFDPQGDKWFKVKTAFITIDEKSAKEKRTTLFMLVQAADFKTAFENFVNGMKGTLADFEIVAITETALMDVFKEKLNG